MKPEIKERWLAALRSNEYTQGHYMLRHGDNFCCLGVLCDLHAKDGLGEWKANTMGEGYEYRPGPAVLGLAGVLPASVSQWAGIGSEGGDPLVNYPAADSDKRREVSLAGLNDAHRLSFAQIADVIEKEL